jgi:hypothetical protein
MRRLPVADQTQMDYNEVFNTPAGKRVLEDILTVTSVLEPTNDYSHEGLAAREGRRDVALHILGQLGYASKNFPEIIEGMTDE